MFDGRKIFKTACFLIRWSASTEERARVAFVFARHSGTSVLRHKYKRRFRALLQTLPHASYLNLVILPRLPLAKITQTQWLDEKKRLTEFLHKTGRAP